MGLRFCFHCGSWLPTIHYLPHHCNLQHRLAFRVRRFEIYRAYRAQYGSVHG